MNYNVFFIVFMLIIFRLNAQTNVDTLLHNGNVEIVQDAKIQELLDKHLELNSKTTVKGYRVKIYFGSEKNSANDIREKFTEKFPEILAYVKYDQPYFSVRVGNYRTKLEAYKFLKQIQGEYPSAFLVQDEIELK